MTRQTFTKVCRVLEPDLSPMENTVQDVIDVQKQVALATIYLLATPSTEQQEYCWPNNGRGHFEKIYHVETLSPISLHYKNGPCFPNEGAIFTIKGHFCPWPLPKLSLEQLGIYLVWQNPPLSSAFTGSVKL